MIKIIELHELFEKFNKVAQYSAFVLAPDVSTIMGKDYGETAKELKFTTADGDIATITISENILQKCVTAYVTVKDTNDAYKGSASFMVDEHYTVNKAVQIVRLADSDSADHVYWIMNQIVRIFDKFIRTGGVVEDR